MVQQIPPQEKKTMYLTFDLAKKTFTITINTSTNFTHQESYLSNYSNNYYYNYKCYWYKDHTLAIKWQAESSKRVEYADWCIKRQRQCHIITYLWYHDGSTGDCSCRHWLFVKWLSRWADTNLYHPQDQATLSD